jgi:Tfp pilus assembly protein PilN
MFTIDLLKGQAIPLKRKPGSLAVVAITVVIPVIAAMGIISFYRHNKIVVSMKQQEITKCQAEIDLLSDAVELHRQLEKKKIAYSSCLAEVKSSIKRHTQWSPVLTTLMENIPDSVVLTSLELEHNFVRTKVPKKDDPKKTEEIDVPVRTLRLSVDSGHQTSSDEAIRDFQNGLRNSAFLGPKLDNIRVSKKSETLEGQNVVSYEMSCLFKPGM